MANYCKYNVIVKGKKNACYAYFGSMSCLETKDIIEEEGTDEDYLIKYTGYCKWSVDSYCTPWEGEFPVILPEDADEAYQAGEELYWYNTVQERSKMFEVEVMCNSADIEDYDVHPHELFEHYINGEDVGSDYSGCNAYNLCPSELRIFGDNEEELEEGMFQCCECFGIYPDETKVVVNDDIALCPECYGDLYAEECSDDDDHEETSEEVIAESAEGDNENNEAEAVEATETEPVAEVEPVAETEPIAKVEPAEETAESQTEGIVVTPEVAAMAAAEEAAKPKKKRSKAWLVLIIIVLTLAALAAVYIFCPPVTGIVNNLISQLLDLIG